jgi:hypothetical protein
MVSMQKLWSSVQFIFKWMCFWVKNSKL